MPVAGDNFADFLLQGKDEQRCALTFPDSSYSYAELVRGVERVSTALARTIGAPVGARALLVDDNSFFWACAYLGTIRSGLVSVPVSPRITQAEWHSILKTTQAEVVFSSSRFAARNREAFSTVHLVTGDTAISGLSCRSQIEFPAILASSDPPTPSAEVSRDKLATLMFTSGSTGRSRGVMVTHGNLIANTTSIIQYLELTEADRIMTVLPWHYCFGASLLHSHLGAGGSSVVDPRFLYPENILDNMIESRCTGFAGVPSHFQTLLRRTSLKKRSFPDLRYVQQAGGRLAPVFVEELRQALPGARVFLMYGQTEATARLSYLAPEDLPSKPGSIGRGIPGVELRVVDASGRDVAPGEVGEIVARGENVTAGYWQDPEETAACFSPDGQLRTGDMATVDQEGFIYIVDRAKDFLKCDGERVSCRSIEDTMVQCPEVLEAAVIGVPDDVQGEAVKVFVIPKVMPCPPDFEARFQQFCRDHLVSRLRPRQIVVVSTLPKSDSNKVLKWKLKDPLSPQSVPVTAGY